MRSFVLVAALGLTAGGAVVAADRPADWAMNATVIEACSCPMFCQCYFNSKPASHAAHAKGGSMGGAHHGGGTHFCRANLAYRVNKGHFGSTRLDGAKFWVANDLGDEFSDGEMEWAVITFDRALSADQRTAVQAIFKHLFPVKWKSVTTAEGTIDTWEVSKDEAHARLDGGKSAEVKLKRFPGMTDEPIVIKNLRYWGVPRHDGFVLMPNEVQAYRVGPKAFEFQGTNGFLITFDMTSADVHP